MKINTRSSTNHTSQTQPQTFSPMKMYSSGQSQTLMHEAISLDSMQTSHRALGLPASQLDGATCHLPLPLIIAMLHASRSTIQWKNHHLKLLLTGSHLVQQPLLQSDLLAIQAYERKARVAGCMYLERVQYNQKQNEATNSKIIDVSVMPFSHVGLFCLVFSFRGGWRQGAV